MITKKLKYGDKVHFQPKYYNDDRWENGIVKEVVNDRIVRVVYNCDNKWDKFYDYTGACTYIEDLKIRWR